MFSISTYYKFYFFYKNALATDNIFISYSDVNALFN